MPDLLDSLIQLLELLKEAKMGWLANTTLVLMVGLSLVYFVSFILFSPRVIKLFKVIVKVFGFIKPKISEAMSSPYDKKVSDNKVFITFSMGMFYIYMLFMLIYSLIFFGLATGLLSKGAVSFSNTLLVYFCAFLFFCFSRFFKCQGDKELVKLRGSKDT